MSFLLFYVQEWSQGSFLTPHETMEMWQFKMSEKIPKDANVLFQSKDRPGTRCIRVDQAKPGPII